MKLEYLLSALLACQTVAEASPIDRIFRHKTPENKQNALASLLQSGLPLPNATNSSYTNTTSNNGTNNTTTSYQNKTNTTKPADSLQVIFTGGQVSITNTSKVHTNTTNLFNSSRALNITQMYDVATAINSTININTTTGAVVVANSRSLEGLGFFSSVLFDNKKPIVISDDSKLAAVVAADKGAASRGTLVVTKDGKIYNGVFAPSSICREECAGIPVGIVTSAGKVQWFFDASIPTLVNSTSIIRREFKNFTYASDFTNSIVPIVYDGEYSSELIESVSGNIEGLVVATTGSSNSTTSPFEDIPVVFAQADSTESFVGEGDVPKGAIAAGYLSPVQAQILLSIAAANGVTETEDVQSLFP
ncbi:Ygp1p NDAI_0F03190 [Naumovozyma dairenensis CBS 421]|uniref:Asparaginase n=1 Tax=Naumovozyma dairenensis (strain ATCC 10597 / BCRC 20456 / CBS 421 / NBRC 0211 / NRRL Y-12639) TaxID=1071378 RepID=G0WCX6_NAUDC|nr:hypothetical protein NDAI_0F03190 [Naumovozyma dairenensis CBS 421]CCD25637.1 hypothetical protein NDAI_0F03190 [Naumovozyma dairenensis CBS 421]